MPIPAYITILYNGKKLKGAVTFPGKEDTTEALEFGHEVKYISEDFLSGIVVREHMPIVFVKPVDSISVILYQILCKGHFIDKVIIDWYRKDEKQNKEIVYFQHILEKVKICSVAMIMNNVKDPRFEQYPHLEKIELRYDRICWNIPEGTIRYTDRWLYAFLIEGMNLSENAEYDKMMGQEALTDSMADEEDAPRETLAITNPRWEHADNTLKSECPDKAHTGDTIILSVGVQGFVNQYKITFDIYDISGSPQRIDTVTGKNEEGKASVEWTVEDPRKPDATKELKLAFEAHAKSKYSDRKEIGFEEDELAKSLIFYLPGSDEYFVVDENECDSLIDEVTFTTTFADKVSTVYKQLSSEQNSDVVFREARKLEDVALEDFEGLDKNPADAIEEMILIKGNKKWGSLKSSVYIRPYKRKQGAVKGHVRKSSDVSIKKKVAEMLDPSPGKKGMDKKLSATLIQSKQIEKDWPDIWKFKGKQKAANESETVGGKYSEFEASAEAQWLRFVAGASVDSSFDWKEKKLELSAQGSISYILGQGKISGTWYLPNKDGADLFYWFRLNEKGIKATKDKRECRIRIKTVADGHAFAGASASGAVALPNIDLGSKKKSMTTEAGASGFAGVSAGGSLTPSFEWSPDKTDFGTLAEVSAGAEGSFGIGGEVKVNIGYEEGTFKMAASAMLVFGPGGKGTVELSFGIDEGFELLAHVFYSVDYHFVKDVMQEAFDAFVAVAFTRFLPESLRKTLKTMGAGKLASLVLGYVQKNLAEAKRTIRANINNPANLKKSPPETLGGEVLRTLMQSVEPDDFNAIIKVLESAKNDHELKWIIRCIVDSKAEDVGGKLLQEGIRRLLEFGRNIDKAKHETYNQRLVLLLRKNGIRYE